MPRIRAWLPSLLLVVGLAGCSSPVTSTTIFDDERTADDELPAAASTIDGFVPESSRLLWQGVDVAYYAAQGDGDPGTVMCLITVADQQATAACSARVPISSALDGGDEVSFGGETAPGADWTKRGDFFWSRD